MSKEFHSVFIGMGSNCGNRFDYILKALLDLKKTPGISIVKLSGLYETEPVGYLDQSDFLNGVVHLSTNESPVGLLKVTQDIEKKLGRQRDIRWGPRTIDLDILLFDDLFINSMELVIPHPEMKNRRFVLEPLAEIASKMLFPNSSQNIAQILAVVSDSSRIRLYESAANMEQKFKEV